MSSRIAVAIFIGAIVLANITVAEFGPWVSPINAFILIGLDLSLRDYLHDMWKTQVWRVGVLIGTAGVISFVLNPAAGRIAIASAVAFTVSGLVDAAVYHGLLGRPFLQRSNGSNIAGAMTDSVLFPTVAFGLFPGIAAVIGLQFAAKVGGGALWSVVIDRVRR